MCPAPLPTRKRTSNANRIEQARTPQRPEPTGQDRPENEGRPADPRNGADSRDARENDIDRDRLGNVRPADRRGRLSQGGFRLRERAGVERTGQETARVRVDHVGSPRRQRERLVGVRRQRVRGAPLRDARQGVPRFPVASRTAVEHEGRRTRAVDRVGRLRRVGRGKPLLPERRLSRPDREAGGGRGNGQPTARAE